MKRIGILIITGAIFFTFTGMGLIDPLPGAIDELPKPRLIVTYIEKEVEYETADYIWKYLKDLGFNDYVCAGILGNIMVEVGGATLNLVYDAYSSDKAYYGICQWSKKYYPDAFGLSLEEQCDFLRDTIEYEMDTFGCGFETFLSIEDSRQASRRFSEGYERCHKSTYSLREDCAEEAYRYFTSRFEKTLSWAVPGTGEAPA